MAPKYVLQHHTADTDRYIAKAPHRVGVIETYTELFNNRLGEALGFHMAHSGLMRIDGSLYFVSRSFLTHDETLFHGKLIVEHVMEEKGKTAKIVGKKEQQLYTIDFLHDVLSQFCGDALPGIFRAFTEMLVFDALIGSMDRHALNWGVVASSTLPRKLRFAPIFDSARALLWRDSEQDLAGKEADNSLLTRYIRQARPCIGPPATLAVINKKRERSKRKHQERKATHLDLMSALLDMYPRVTADCLLKVDALSVRAIGAKLLNNFPFDVAFSGLRKRLILNVLQRRAEELDQLKGGIHGQAPGVAG